MHSILTDTFVHLVNHLLPHPQPPHHSTSPLHHPRLGHQEVRGHLLPLPDAVKMQRTVYLRAAAA